jgi:alginate O-acetyltransferase complex protein AlgI
VLFTSLEYLVFLPLAFAAFWTLKSRRVELLLVASYIFYASWSIPYALLVFGMAVSNYIFGLIIGRAGQGSKRLLLIVFVAFDLGVLALFKYWDFAAANIWPLAHTFLGVTADPVLLRLVLPLGISFFTFEFIHYLVDISRGAVPVHGFSKFHVFAAFFPTQIAGPIKRFQQFVPSLEVLGKFDRALALDGLRLIAVGVAKKVLLADRLAPMANRGFGAAADAGIGTTDAWISVLAFSLQIFFDFSGYTDIARGSAQLFGFHIPLNFDAPYLATSVSDFWRRWHISLSSWLRDYLFIPLGGSRRPMPIIVRNLMITMALGGLWHGAAWHFVGWGVFWGAALAVHHLVRGRARLGSGLLQVVTGWAITQLVVLVGWVLFRAESFGAAATMLRAMVVPTSSSGVQSLTGAAFVFGTAAVLVLGTLALRSRRVPRLQLPAGVPRPAFVGAAAALVMAVGAVAAPSGSQTFIYFQF